VLTDIGDEELFFLVILGTFLDSGLPLIGGKTAFGIIKSTSVIILLAHLTSICQVIFMIRLWKN